MNEFENREELIAALTQEAAPVRRVTQRQGLMFVGIATLLAAALSIVVFGFWDGMLNGDASAFFWITNGLLLVLGTASAAALVAGAQPRVGARANAPLWAAAMLFIVPIAAVITLFSSGAGAAQASFSDPSLYYWPCAVSALLAGGLVALGAVVFLRRGAPVSIARSGWLTGLAAGALGSLAYGITCPLDGISHVGLVHVIPVAISAVIGRIVVPPLIRW